MAKFWGGGDCVDYKLQKINNVGAGEEGFGYMVRLGLVRCSAGSCRCLSLLLKTHFSIYFQHNCHLELQRTGSETF